MRRGLLAAALAVPAALMPTGVAAAANADVRAVDGTAANSFVNSWSPRDVSVGVGDTVTWRFEGTTVAHNVVPDNGVPNSTSWNMPPSPVAANQPPVSWQFDAAGVYAFICQVHPEMTGRVLVGQSAPPPPPTSTGPEPWPNPQVAPSDFERTDDEDPRVTGLQANGVRRGARIRFTLSEPAEVTIRLKRGRRTARFMRTSFDEGSHRLTLRSSRLRGRYRVQVVARDRAGNTSRRKHDRVRVSRG